MEDEELLHEFEEVPMGDRRQSEAFSEMVIESAQLNELIPELYLVPNTDPPKYNMK